MLFLKWLEMPHIKLWWDKDIEWSLELIEQKYSSYVRGYKLENNEPKIYTLTLWKQTVLL